MGASFAAINKEVSEINEEEAAESCLKTEAMLDSDPKTHSVQAKTVNINGQVSVKILTINIFMRPIVNTNGSDHKEGRLKAFADKYMGEYDIICFQELFDWLSTRKHRIILEAKTAGMPYHAFSPGPQFFSTYCTDGGLLTISKFPIVRSEFARYKFPAVGDDAIAMKGVLYTEIDLAELGGDKLHLFHSHF